MFAALFTQQASRNHQLALQYPANTTNHPPTTDHRRSIRQMLPPTRPTASNTVAPLPNDVITSGTDSAELVSPQRLYSAIGLPPEVNQTRVSPVVSLVFAKHRAHEYRCLGQNVTRNRTPRFRWLAVSSVKRETETRGVDLADGAGDVGGGRGYYAENCRRKKSAAGDEAQGLKGDRKSGYQNNVVKSCPRYMRATRRCRET